MLTHVIFGNTNYTTSSLATSAADFKLCSDGESFAAVKAPASKPDSPSQGRLWTQNKACCVIKVQLSMAFLGTANRKSINVVQQKTACVDKYHNLSVLLAFVSESRWTALTQQNWWTFNALIMTKMSIEQDGLLIIIIAVWTPCPSTHVH